MFTIALCCGVAVNSSNMGEDILKDAFKERGITNVKLIKCHISDVDSWLAGADLIIPFLLFTVKTDKPVIGGVPMVSGGRKKRAEVIDQIIGYIPKEYGGTKEGGA
jgi:galactitol-specific phosphotransferase system IIB component